MRKEYDENRFLREIIGLKIKDKNINELLKEIAVAFCLFIGYLLWR